MSLNKKKMVREVGRRTRLKNRDVQTVVETLIEVWIEELAAGGRIEVENFMVLVITDKARSHSFYGGTREIITTRKLRVKAGKQLQELLNT